MIYALVTADLVLVVLAIWGLVLLSKYFPRGRGDSFVYFHDLEYFVVKSGESDFVLISIPVTAGSIQIQLNSEELALIQIQGDELKMVRVPVTEISKSELAEKFDGSPVTVLDQVK